MLIKLDLADKSISTLKRVNFLNLTMLIELDLDGFTISELADVFTLAQLEDH